MAVSWEKKEGGKWFLLEITIVDEPQQHRIKMEDAVVRIQKWVKKNNFHYNLYPQLDIPLLHINFHRQRKFVPRVESERLATREKIHVNHLAEVHICQQHHRHRRAITRWLAQAAIRVSWQFQNLMSTSMNITDKIIYKRLEREISPSDVVQLNLFNDSRKF